MLLLFIQGFPDSAHLLAAGKHPAMYPSPAVPAASRQASRLRRQALAFTAPGLPAHPCCHPCCWAGRGWGCGWESGWETCQGAKGAKRTTAVGGWQFRSSCWVGCWVGLGAVGHAASARRKRGCRGPSRLQTEAMEAGASSKGRHQDRKGAAQLTLSSSSSFRAACGGGQQRAQ